MQLSFSFSFKADDVSIVPKGYSRENPIVVDGAVGWHGQGLEFSKPARDRREYPPCAVWIGPVSRVNAAISAAVPQKYRM